MNSGLSLVRIANVVFYPSRNKRQEKWDAAYSDESSLIRN